MPTLPEVAMYNLDVPEFWKSAMVCPPVVLVLLTRKVLVEEAVTCKRAVGEVVPMPRLPEVSMRIASVAPLLPT